VTRFRLVEAEAAQFPVSLLCRVVGVTRQGFYAWKRRPPSARELADRKLAKRIREIYTETDEIYGAPRVYSELKLGDGIPIGKKRVALKPAVSEDAHRILGPHTPMSECPRALRRDRDLTLRRDRDLLGGLIHEYDATAA